MKAFVLEDFDAEPRLRDDLPEPEPGDGELAVRVHASSVNPVDNAVVGGAMRDLASYVFPVIIGRDFAGVVQQAGPGSQFAESDGPPRRPPRSTRRPPAPRRSPR